MAWEPIRKATEEDRYRLEKAAEQFIMRHEIEMGECPSNGYELVADEIDTHLDAVISGAYAARMLTPKRAKQLQKMWRRIAHRALKEFDAEGIRDGMVGYSVLWLEPL